MSFADIVMPCDTCHNIGLCDTCKIHARPIDAWAGGPCANYDPGKEREFAGGNSTGARIGSGAKKKALRMSDCHPRRPHAAHGLCKICNSQRRRDMLRAKEAN